MPTVTLKTIETREKLVWSGNRIVEFQGIGRDITERKRAEDALRESERRYRELVENIDDIVYVTDGTGKILYLNRALARVSGYTRDELIRKNYIELLAPESVKKIPELFERQRKGEDIGPFDLSIVDKGGEIRTVEMRETLIWKDGKVVEAHGLGRDITEWKRAQERIAHLNRLLRSLRNIDQLIAKVKG